MKHILNKFTINPIKIEEILENIQSFFQIHGIADKVFTHTHKPLILSMNDIDVCESLLVSFVHTRLYSKYLLSHFGV